MRKGDVVLIPFPFSDLSGQKVRPALLLFIDESARDMIVAFLMSQVAKLGWYDLMIEKSKQNGLKVDSALRLTKLATLDTKIAIARIGSIEQEHFAKILINLSSLFSE